MWSKKWAATVALLVLQSAVVTAADSFHSSGPATACPGYRLPNSTVTVFDLSVTPDNSTISFVAQLLSTIAGQVTFGLAIIADGNEKYKSNFDPCTLDTGAGLCPAIDGVVGMDTSLSIPEDLAGTFDLSAAENVTAQLWVDPFKANSSQHMACVETTLRSDASAAERGSGNSTSGGNSSSSENGTASGDSTKDSGASSLQAAWSVGM